MTETTSLRIDPDLKSRLDAFASLHRQPADQLINEAIKSYLDLKEDETELLAAADDAWDDFKRHGQGLPLDEVSGWLRSWGTDEEKDAPKCRKL